MDRRLRVMEWSEWRQDPDTCGPMDIGIGGAAAGRGRGAGGRGHRIRVRAGSPDAGRSGTIAGAAGTRFGAGTGADHWPRISR
jgi:hypothetical protein